MSKVRQPDDGTTPIDTAPTAFPAGYVPFRVDTAALRALAEQHRKYAKVLFQLGDAGAAHTFLEAAALAGRIADGDLTLLEAFAQKLDALGAIAQQADETRALANPGDCAAAEAAELLRANYEQQAATRRTQLAKVLAHYAKIVADVRTIPADAPERPAALAVLRLAKKHARRARAELDELDELDRVARQRDAKRAAIDAQIKAAANKPLLARARALIKADKRMHTLRRRWAAENRRLKHRHAARGRSAGIERSPLRSARRIQPRARRRRGGARRLARAPTSDGGPPEPPPLRAAVRRHHNRLLFSAVGGLQ